MRLQTAVLLTATLGLLLGVPAHADLLGTDVTGSITFTSNFVPPINDYGVTVPIGPGPEFDASYGEDTLIADFSTNTLTLVDYVVPIKQNESILGAYGWTQTFVDDAFIGLNVNKLSDTYDNGGISYSLNGNTLTVHWDGTGLLASAQDPVYSATFSLPEPSSIGLLIVALLALLVGLRHRCVVS